MYHIAEAMTRWIAPVLSFTAEELWHNLPGQHTETIFTETYYDQLAPLSGGSLFTGKQWDLIVRVRIAVSKELEKLRVDGAIGGSLDADVQLFCDDQLKSLLAKLDGELRFVLIVSDATVNDENARPASAASAELEGNELWITAGVSPHPKCTRCWHHRPEVGQIEAHPELCARCVENVDGEGEVRNFA